MSTCPRTSTISCFSAFYTTRLIRTLPGKTWISLRANSCHRDSILHFQHRTISNCKKFAFDTFFYFFFFFKKKPPPSLPSYPDSSNFHFRQLALHAERETKKKPFLLGGGGGRASQHDCCFFFPLPKRRRRLYEKIVSMIPSLLIIIAVM